jgi:tetratricopeptide (TPR) repeat protein
MADQDNAAIQDQAGAEALGRLCRSLLDLLQSQSVDQTLVANTFAPLAGAIAHECLETAARLRREVASWKGIADELERLSHSPFIHLEAETTPLLTKLTTAQAHAARVIEALEAISNGHAVEERPPPAAVEIAPRPSLDTTRHDLSPTVAELPAGDAESLQLQLGVRDAYLERGRLRVQQQPAAAIDDFTRALQLRDDDPEAYIGRGNACALCGRHEDAVADYTRALKLRPDLVLVRYNRAVSLRHAGRHDEALSELGQLIPLKPDYAPIYLNCGLIHLARNNPRLAVQEFKTALVHQPGSREAAQRLREAQTLLAATRQATTPARPARSDHTVETESDPELEAADRARPGIEALPVLDSEEDLAEALLASLPSIESLPPAEFPEAVAETRTPGPQAGGALTSPLNLDFECPGCSCTSSVRWDKMQRGKILSCPHCRRNFTTRATGELAEVVRDKAGRWADREQQLDEQRGLRAHRLRVTTITGIVGLVLLVACWAPQIVRSSSPNAEAELPTEMKPRAELFARAWLEGDHRTLRRLTDPVQDKLMFNWCRQNPAPAPPIDPKTEKLADGIKIEVEVLPAGPQFQWLRVRIRDLPDKSELQLDLAWVERGGVWLFQPAPGT